MSDIIKFDTEDSLTQGTVTPQETTIFNLVSCSTNNELIKKG